MTVENPKYWDLRWSAEENRWESAKKVIGDRRITLGPQASQQWLDAPDHLAMVLARYRAAAALIGDAKDPLEIGCGEGIGAPILWKGRACYNGIDTDEDAITVANQMHRDQDLRYFSPWDVFNLPHTNRDAIVALDVIEHIPNDREDEFMQACHDMLEPYGVLVLGTPNKAFEHLASPQSKAGHVNLLDHGYLHALMSRYFHVVQSFGMQDTSLHLGHPEARHYLMLAGIVPR